MKTLIIGLAVALSLLVTAVLVGPGFIDWNGYREPIARQISALTGRTVTIGGPVDFALLPTPTLSARGVRVASPEGAAFPDTMTVGALDVRVALLPLLSGRVEAERVVLVDPVLVLETLPDGSAAWSSDGGFQPREVQLDRVTVENGTVLWRDGRTGREERIGDVFAQFSARSLTGPFQLVGSLSARDRRWTVDLTAGRLSSSGAVPVNATIGLDGASGELRFGGLVALEPMRLQGDVKAVGGNLADVLAQLMPGRPPPEIARRPFTASASLLATGESAELNALKVEFGDTRATGAISLALGTAPRLDVALNANRWDLDAFLADGGIPVDPLSPETFQLSSDWTATIDLAVEALTWRGALIRGARVEGVLSDGVLALNRLSAELPGAADVALVGTVRFEEREPYVDLSGQIAANDLRRLIGWAGYPVEGVSGDRLRRMTGAARLSGSPRQFTLTGVEATLDGTQVTGGLAYIDQGRPGFGLRLEIDRLDLDAYWPGGRVPLTAPDILRRLTDAAGAIDANVDATIGSITLAGTTLDDVRLDGTLSGGALTFRRAEIGALAGAAVGITGTVASLEPLSGIDLTVDFATDELARIAERVGVALPPARFDPVRLGGRIRGDRRRLDLQWAGRLAGGTVELGGAVAAPFDRPVHDLVVRVGHPRLASAVALVAPDYAPRAELGALDLYAEISGPADRLVFANLQGTAGPVSMAGEVTLDRTGGRPVLDAKVRTSAIPLDDFLPADRRDQPPLSGRFRWSPMALDPLLLNRLDGTLALTAAGITVNDVTVTDPALRLRLADGALALEGMSGGLFGGRMGLAGQIAAGEELAAVLSLDLVGADLASALAAGAGLDGLSGTLDFGVDLTARGNSQEALMTSLEGEGLVAARDGAVEGLDLAEASRLLAAITEPLGFLDVVRRSLSGGRTPFATLNATFAVEAGVARTDDLRLVAKAGVGRGRGSVDLARWQIDLATEYTLYDHPQAPPFELALVGPLGDPQPRLQTQALQAYIARRAAEALSERFRDASPEAEEAPPGAGPADAAEPPAAGSLPAAGG